MNPLTTFNFHTHSVRTFPTKGGTSFWVVAKDVATALNFRDSTNALMGVPEKHKGTRKVSTLGGKQKMLCLTEAGMYRMILRSNKPEAEPFMDWITEEVLPAIRQTGSYSVAEPEIDFLDIPTYYRRQHEKLERELLTAKPLWARIKHYRDMGLNMAETSLLVRRATSTIRKHVRRMEACGLLEAPSNLISMQKVAHLHLAQG